MAVPTITGISQSFGHTGGRQFVEVEGTNFRQQTPQVNPTGPLPKPPPSVEVEFGGVLATKVLVTGTTRLIALTGERDEGSALDVVARNIDDSGVLIPGEEATLAGAYNYRRVQLSTASPLLRVVYDLIISLRRQIHPTITLSVHTDLDEDSGVLLNIARIATVPAIILVGPTIVKSDAPYQVNPHTTTDDTPAVEEFTTVQALEAYDVAFDLLLVSDNKNEFTNLIEAVVAFHRKVKGFVHPITGDDIELRLTAAPSTNPRPGNDNMFVARGETSLLGFQLGTFPGFAAESGLELGRKTLDSDAWCELQEVTQLSQTYGVGAITFEPALPSTPFP